MIIDDEYDSMNADKVLRFVDELPNEKLPNDKLLIFKLLTRHFVNIVNKSNCWHYPDLD
jgi:hypothetical protein